MIDWLVAYAPTLKHWLILSSALFAIGLYGVLARRNAISILMSIEIMLNSAVFNLIVFNRYIAPKGADGQVFALFVIAVAAAEVVVGLAIFVTLFNRRKTLDVTQVAAMKD
jgi:NADH:ubiquinone oxidoreductase subunit K